MSKMIGAHRHRLGDVLEAQVGVQIAVDELDRFAQPVRRQPGAAACRAGNHRGVMPHQMNRQLPGKRLCEYAIPKSLRFELCEETSSDIFELRISRSEIVE